MVSDSNQCGAIAKMAHLIDDAKNADVNLRKRLVELRAKVIA